MRVAVLTSKALAALHPDDALVAAEAAPLGLTLEPVVWTAPRDLAAYDAVLLRTPWDWTAHRAAFRELLDELAALGRPVLNPAPMLRRYADKSYFTHLQALGVATVPTRFVAPAQLAQLDQVAADLGWAQLVLKPAFTASAAGARRFSLPDAAAEGRAALAEGIEGQWMLQPYLPEVEADGEWSLVFIGGAFSHAVVKRPKAGDYRVQEEHGGRSALAAPSPALVAQAQAIVSRAVPDALFARVDGVVRDGALWLMELEVVEPELFLRLAPGAPARLAQALAARLGA